MFTLLAHAGHIHESEAATVPATSSTDHWLIVAIAAGIIFLVLTAITTYAFISRRDRRRATVRDIVTPARND